MATINIPNPLPTSHQELMNVFYTAWNAINSEKDAGERHATQAEIAAIMPAKVNMAVMLGNLNYQVENGGFSQWHGNDYWTAGQVIVPFLAAASSLDIEGAEAMCKVVDAAMNDLEDSVDSDFENHAGERLCDSHDTAYYALNDTQATMQRLLDRFDEIVAHRVDTYFCGGFRLAA